MGCCTLKIDNLYTSYSCFVQGGCHWSTVKKNAWKLVEKYTNQRSAIKKRISGERSWCGQGVYSPRQQEYQVILELSGEFSVKDLCEHMDISRSSFYYWKSRLNNPSTRTKTFISNILLFKEYHERYPSHGYRWLNAKIRLDTGLIVSDAYAHKCCKTAG